VKKIALSVASALLIVLAAGGVATAASAAAQPESGPTSSQGAGTLTTGWG
jgi:hypothetical protein